MMARVYATRDDDGRRVLVEIECDSCPAKTKPGDIDGWTKRGQDHGPGTDKLEWHACPKCSERVST